MRNHKDLDVWKRSIALVLDVYKLSNGFPKTELYGLSSQMRRCAVSIPSNIAEGAARKSKKEFNHHLYISLGSLAELETQLIIGSGLGYLKSMDGFDNKIISLKQMLNGLIAYNKNKSG